MNLPSLVGYFMVRSSACGADVINNAFFDVDIDSLDYSVEADGSVKLSERPYLQVSPLIFLSHESLTVSDPLPG